MPLTLNPNDLGDRPFMQSVDRPRLVALCFRLTRDREAAEDLAQETLVEAWDHRSELRDPERLPQWLNGIARFRCLRWLRARGREGSQRFRPSAPGDDETASLDDLPSPDLNVEVELERSELADLLDRAMSSLPDDTRRALLQKYVNESSQLEIARCLGVSEGAVEARLQRGKLALRRILTTDLFDEALTYGLVDDVGLDGWEETKLWCPICGSRRLLGRFSDGHRRMRLACPACVPLPAVATIADTGIAENFGAICGYRAGVARLLDWMVAMLPHLPGDPITCPTCRRPCQPRNSTVTSPTMTVNGRLITQIACAHCTFNSMNLIAGLALALPESRRFWREHPRIYLLPEQSIDVDGRPALVVRTGAIDSAATLDVLVRLDTLHCRTVKGGPCG